MPQDHPPTPPAVRRPSRFMRRRPEDPLTRRDEALAFSDDEQAWQAPGWFQNVVVVLFETNDVVNIGGVARAMGNTGLSQLRLIKPVPFDPWDVIGVAHYTQHIVEPAPIFDSTEAALADTHFVVGFSGKHHRAKRNATPFGDLVPDLAERAAAGEKVALLFGREDWGLSNAALDHCHAVTTIPTNPAYPSLNLAQAVLLAGYALFQHAGGMQQTFRRPRRPSAPADSALMEELFLDLERALDAIEFTKTRARESTMSSLRGALYRAHLDRREVSLLRAIVIEVRRFLKRKGVLAEVGPVGRGTTVDKPADGMI